jgi:uncharacterized protein (TIGR02646 family)
MKSGKHTRGVPPKILFSETAENSVNDILRRKALLGHPNMRILLNEELLYELEKIFNSKCAFCERKISVAHSTLFVGHYRPYAAYYWLVYEWTNIFPLCEDCFCFREQQFPIANEENRLKLPPENRIEWAASYALKEVPLIINPDIDAAEHYFYFDRDGKILPVNQHIRALTSINIFKLNQGFSVIGRRKKISEFIRIFHTKLQDFLLSYPQGNDDKNIAQEFFGNAISLLTLNAEHKAEFPTLGKDLIKNFDYYFIQTLSNENLKKTLESAFYSCLSLKANSAARKIVMQTDDKPLEQFYSFESIQIRNIKCFDDIQIAWHDVLNKKILLLVGSNGSGKSSVLQLIALALSGVHKPPAQYAWDEVIKNPQLTAQFSIKTTQNGGNETSEMLFEVDKFDIIHCRSHKEFYESVKRHTLVLAYGTGRSHAQSDGLSYKNFEGIASLFGENRFFKSLFDEDVQMIIGEKFEEYKNLINQIFGKIYENEEIRLESFSSREFYFKTLTGGLTTLNSLSDGAQTLFSWFFDMLIRVVQDGYDIEQPEKIHAIVLIDEIDMHLNLHLQKTFIPAIEEIFPLVQFIITTQSPFTIQSMGYNNVLFLENIAGKISVVPFCYAGKPWAWSLTDIFSRMVGHSVELSYKLDKKMTEYRKAKAEQNSELALKIYSELLSAIPENSPVLQYISEL